MFTLSQALLRRRGVGHVVKYLEGVPTPETLIDHLAGANLHASAELPFFTTVPRYVDTQREQRTSKLFFHHVLYPAGGARLPYQTVVVRNGRAVRTSTPRLWCKTAAAAAETATKEKRSNQQEKVVWSSADASSKAMPPRANPLAVPASQLGSSPSSTPPHETNSNSSIKKATTTTTTASMEDVPSSADWARVDLARRPFFSTQASSFTSRKFPNRYRNTYADNGPAATNTHLSRSIRCTDDTFPAVRAVEDDMLTPLRGVLEHYWNPSDVSAPGEQQEAKKLSVFARLPQRLEELLLSPSAGLLQMSGAKNSSDSAVSSDNAEAVAADLNPSSAWEMLVKSIQQSVIADAAAAALSAPRSPQRSSERLSTNTFAYVQTRLPPAAAVTLPLEPRDGDNIDTVCLSTQKRYEGGVFLCRMAGGVEPVVPFAVGRPLTASAATASPSDIFFSHISCITRVNMKVTLTKTPAPSSAVEAAVSPNIKASAIVVSSFSKTQQRELNDSAALKAKARPAKPPLPPQSPVERWKLGDDGLDLMLPQHVRTVAERNPAKFRLRSPPSSAQAGSSESAVGQDVRFVLGRTDAETYLLPQRELLLTLHVPAHTEEMCAAQNDERLRRQVRSGRASRQSVMAWPTEQTRLTSSRRALGQYANAESAGKTGTPLNSLPSSTSSSPSSCSFRGVELVSRTSYEVRALPGDVVYIPRGWGYEVQRILGTATIHNECNTRGSASKANADNGAFTYEFRDHRAFGSKHGSLVTMPRPTCTSVALHEVELQKNQKTPEKAEGTTTASTHVTSVEVDALCLSYQPYPELTAAQAAVYVAANYVHTGVEEFYEKGGNEVYRSYE